MKKHGILNAQLIGELTKIRHQDKITICDAGMPVPAGKPFVDVSLVQGLPTVEQVFKAVCNEILIEEIAFPEVFLKYRPAFYTMIQERFIHQKINTIANTDWASFAYADDVRLYIRTSDVLPCGNIVLTSASGVPTHFHEFNVEFDDVIGGAQIV